MVPESNPEIVTKAIIDCFPDGKINFEHIPEYSNKVAESFLRWHLHIHLQE